MSADRWHCRSPGRYWTSAMILIRCDVVLEVDQAGLRRLQFLQLVLRCADDRLLAGHHPGRRRAGRSP